MSGGSLGINAKFANAGSPEAPVAGLKRARSAFAGIDVEKLRGDDLRVFKVAQRWRRLYTVQQMVQKHRVEKCYRVRYKKDLHPEVWVSEEHKSAHYKNLIMCASLWVCPVCAAKITERRKIEIETAPRINDFSKFMVTYTLQHNRADRLGLLTNDLLDGLRDMKNARRYKDLIDHLGVVGTITGAEVTVSNLNGWHPHKHGLTFAKVYQDKINESEIQEELSKLFISAMAHRGRYVHADIGVHVKTANVIAAYVAKMGEGEKHWSLAAEIAKSPVKTSREEDHFHPFELIDMYQEDHNMNAIRLFQEFVKAMKGVNQLRYSKGLRKLLGLDAEISDQELAEHIEKGSHLFARIHPKHWEIILNHNERGRLLSVASHGNYEAFVTYMRAVGCDDFGV